MMGVVLCGWIGEKALVEVANRAVTMARLETFIAAVCCWEGWK